ncbi:crossover junction endodeoxyribonuclease RuvC [Duodenibacillus massiliensis]|uniref:crossover junction endodeoxyribonuclease RuvC n=1 Tax=Duodenibacillus massiliensis TaxID=1852381 RepID=UPI003A94BF38
MSETTRILGIDPGLNRTGFGVIDAVEGKLTVVTAGCIRIPADDLSERLGTIYRSLSQIIEETKPTVAAAEIVFVNINPRSTLLLGQARGAALTCAAVHNLRVHEFTPSEIKQSAVGTGRATKEQVQMMMGEILGIRGPLQADAADALACAVTCAHTLRLADVTKLGKLQARTGTRSLKTASSRRSAWTQLAQNRNKESK